MGTVVGAAAAWMGRAVDAALMALGYPKAQAERAVLAAEREEGEQTIEAILKRSLKRLSR